MSYQGIDEWWNDTEAKAPSSGGGLLPAGKYDAVIDRVEMATWNDGSACVDWHFIVTDGEYAGSATNMRDSFDEKKRARTKGHFEAAGFKGLPFSQIVPRFGELKGRAVEISVSEFQGKLYTHLNAIDEAAPAPAPAQQAALPGVPEPVIPFL